MSLQIETSGKIDHKIVLKRKVLEKCTVVARVSTQGAILRRRVEFTEDDDFTFIHPALVLERQQIQIASLRRLFWRQSFDTALQLASAHLQPIVFLTNYSCTARFDRIPYVAR